jgi:hypothetical protein
MIGRPRGPGRPAAVTDPADNPEDAYRLLVIEPTSAPDGSGGKDWFTYRITQGTNSIRGYKRGSREAVTAEVEQIVVSLNERRGVRRGRVDLTTTPKAVVQAAAPPSDADS